MPEMNNNYYCAAHFHENGYCLARHANCHGNHCPNWHRKWPTPEEFEKEYGYEWTGAVYQFHEYLNNWVLKWKNTIEKDLGVAICACTPFAPPSPSWRPDSVHC